MKKDFNIDDVLDKIEKAWQSRMEDRPPVKIHIGKDEDGQVTNYIELSNESGMRIGTGIGGFKLYLERVGDFCPDIVVNGFLMNSEQKKAIIEAVLDGKYLMVNDID